MRSRIPALGTALFVVATAAAMAAGSASATFSHDEWSRVLAGYVDESGRVDYRGLARDRADLDAYVERIADTGPRTRPELFPDRKHELAYYINAYNALVFAGVLERGPEEDSVWKGGVISGYRFFAAMKVQVDGQTTNLRKLENKLIRSGFEDPRIHAALNCASIGCPRLPQDPFLPGALDAQLDAAMREFVNDERHVRVDARSRSVELSKIFDWFTSDFVDHEEKQGTASAKVIDYVNRYRPDDAQIDRAYKVRFLRYDKAINKQD